MLSLAARLAAGPEPTLAVPPEELLLEEPLLEEPLLSEVVLTELLFREPPLEEPPFGKPPVETSAATVDALELLSTPSQAARAQQSKMSAANRKFIEGSDRSAADDGA
jgi:hypothetical protein